MDTFKGNAKVHPDNESIEMEDERIWIESNITMKKCTKFTSKVGDICHCGYNKDKHPPGSEAEEWVESNIETLPTNAFGEVEFQSFGQKIGRYVRVNDETDMKTVIDLITEQWKLRLPNLLISVTGGAKNFQMKPQLKEVFRRGLVKLARSTGAWVTSAGLNAGVMKHVGEAIRDYGFTMSGRDKVVAIGIAPWGCVQNKDLLINKDNDCLPVQYHITNENQRNASPLDPNHSHFILVDDGTQNEFGTEITFRTKLENAISEKKFPDETDVTIPVVVVMVEGGRGTLQTVYNSVVRKTPVIVVKGSGRAADILAYAYKSREEELNRDVVISDRLKESLREKIRKEFGNEKVEEQLNYVCGTLEYPNLITVFEMGSKDSVRDIDMAVLKALLKENKGSDIQTKKKNLRLTLQWNRIDVAKSEVFADETQWPTEELDTLMFTALLQDRVDFVKLFLDYGVILKKFLTKERLEDLYMKTVKTPLTESLFHNASKDKYTKIDTQKVADVINGLMGDDYFLYSYKNGPDVPANELFLWAVIMNRTEMAFLFWKEGMEALPAALVANRLLNAMKNRSQDYDQKNKLQAHADLFEERSIGVLTECYASDEKSALELLVLQRDNWGQTSCILIAVNSDNKRFISQTACQSLLSNIWMGDMDNSNHNSKLILSIFCPIFILLLITFVTDKDKVNGASESKHSSDTTKPKTWTQKILSFYNAPVITFITNVVCYVIFLMLFSYVLLVEFNETCTPIEYLLYFWVFTIFVEELRQVYFHSYVRAVRNQIQSHYAEVCAKYSSLVRIKITNYFTDVWNIVDLTNIVLFLIGIVTRYFDEVDAARVILSFNLMLFYFRVLHIFSVHKELGPKLVMIKKMVQDLGYFVAILFVFLVAYGIASQAILYPNTPFSTDLFKGVLKKPYFQMYGELFLEEIEGEKCNESPLPAESQNTSLNNKCPTNLGIKIVPIMMGFYILLTNVLLLNLLIAMFSNTFQKIQENTDLHWHFQRFGLIAEYDTRPSLPPPFILLSHIYLLFCIISNKCGTKENKEKKFKKTLLKLRKQLVYREDEMTDCYLMNKEKLENNSMEGKVFMTSDRTEQMMMKIGELQLQQQHLCSAPNLPVTQLPLPTQNLIAEMGQMGTKFMQLENEIKDMKDILLKIREKL